MSEMAQPSARGDRQRVLTPEIITLAVVVVLGAIMTVLDATIVNVAIPTLGRDFTTSLSTVQWVLTIYLLGFATVIPVSGWASERFGAKPVWMVSLTAFMLGSLMSGLSWSIESLIAFRALQGLGAGMLMPVGQSILAQAAGPQRMGRVMSIVGVPVLLAPIFGPVIGGAIVDSASWRWIFFVNLPIGAVALLLAARLLPSVPPRPYERLDVLGMTLLSGGIAVFVYGLSELGAHGRVTDPVPLAALAAGAVLIAGFTWHALRTPNPLLDVRLFARRGFGTAAATNLMVGLALFGILLLLPLYFQIVRGQSPLTTGLLLIPQGLGAAITMPIAGSLTDRIGARRVVPAGIAVALLGTAAYTQIGADTPYWYLATALFTVGVGLGATVMPSMAVAYQAVTREAIPRATSAMNTILRIAGSLGVALLAVALERAIAADLPGFHGGVAQAAALVASDPDRTRPALAHAFGTTFWVAVALTAVALIPALFLPDARAGGAEAEDSGLGRPRAEADQAIRRPLDTAGESRGTS
jgi:EmrB/QacA subfamily drug resistance transporter